jgi:hypothetical protein
MSGILTQIVGQCKMQIWRHPKNSNQMTDVFTFHFLKLGSAFAQLLSRSSIMTVGTSSTRQLKIIRVRCRITRQIVIVGEHFYLASNVGHYTKDCSQ